MTGHSIIHIIHSEAQETEGTGPVHWQVGRELDGPARWHRGKSEGHGPDGLRVATDGSIWASGKGGINVVKADGALTCSIPFPNHVANLAFGGGDGKQILVTSADKVYTINLK